MLGRTSDAFRVLERSRARVLLQMLAQREQVAKVQEDYPEMRLLHGCELNIGRDGSVDYDLDFQLGFDWTVASVHSFFDLDRNQQTERVIRAMANPAVSAIGHLSGRYIGRRPGIELDLEAVMKAAAATGTAIEINGALQRLDAEQGVDGEIRQPGHLHAGVLQAVKAEQVEVGQVLVREVPLVWVLPVDVAEIAQELAAEYAS